MKNEVHFTAAQFRNHPEFLIYKDLISVIADENKLYTEAEFQKLIDSYAGKEEERC